MESELCWKITLVSAIFLAYDGRTVHGVEDIDPHLPLDLDTLNGRIGAFATLFKVM